MILSVSDKSNADTHDSSKQVPSTTILDEDGYLPPKALKKSQSYDSEDETFIPFVPVSANADVQQDSSEKQCTSVNMSFSEEMKSNSPASSTSLEETISEIPTSPELEM